LASIRPLQIRVPTETFRTIAAVPGVIRHRVTLCVLLAHVGLRGAARVGASATVYGPVEHHGQVCQVSIQVTSGEDIRTLVRDERLGAPSAGIVSTDVAPRSGGGLLELAPYAGDLQVQRLELLRHGSLAAAHTGARTSCDAPLGGAERHTPSAVTVSASDHRHGVTANDGELVECVGEGERGAHKVEEVCGHQAVVLLALGVHGVAGHT
jgi:hypothetical protein